MKSGDAVAVLLTEASELLALVSPETGQAVCNNNRYAATMGRAGRPLQRHPSSARAPPGQWADARPLPVAAHWLGGCAVARRRRNLRAGRGAGPRRRRRRRRRHLHLHLLFFFFFSFSAAGCSPLPDPALKKSGKQ